MDSSDEELFEAIPSTSTSNTSSEWVVDTSMQSLLKKNQSSDTVPIKNISIKLTRLSGIKSITKQQKLSEPKSRNRFRKWKFGYYQRRKKSPTKLLANNTKETELIAKVTLESLKNKVSDAASCEEAGTVTEQLHTDASENTQDTQKDNSLIVPIHEVENEEEQVCDKETIELTSEAEECARVLPYELHQKWKKISNTTDTLTCSEILNSETEEQNTRDKSYRSEHEYPTEAQVRRNLYVKTSQPIPLNSSIQNQLQIKRKMSDDVSDNDLSMRKKRCRRISSSSSSASSSGQTTAASNVGADADNNSIKFRSFHESMDQEISRPNVEVDRKLQVSLIRLEEMNDPDVVKWQESRTQNSLEAIPEAQSETEPSDNSKGVVTRSNKQLRYGERSNKQLCYEEYLNTKGDVATKRRSFINSLQRNELILKEEQWMELLFPQSTLKRKNVCEEPLELLATSSSNSANQSDKLTNLLDTQALKKKYKLYKKPKVFLMRLECLKYSSNDDKYSAAKIEDLTQKYITSVKSPRSAVAETKDGNINPSTPSEQNRNESCEQSVTEENSTRDTEVTETNSDENAPFKILRNALIPLSQNKSARTLDGVALQQLWQNAFVPKKNPQVATAKQSTSTQSLSIAPSKVLQKSPKKSTDTGRDKSNFSSSASTSTSKVLQMSPKKSTDTGRDKSNFSSSASTFMSSQSQKTPVTHTSPKKHAETEVISRCIETPKRVVPDYAYLPNNTSVAKIVSKYNVPQFGDKVASKSPRKDATNEVTVSNSSSSPSNLGKSRKLGFYVEREASDRSPSKTPEKSKASIGDKTPVKSKISEEQHNQLPCKTATTHQYHQQQYKYKCMSCTAQFDNYQVLLHHMEGGSCKASTANFTDKIHSSESPVSQQCPAVNKESDSQVADRSLGDSLTVNSDPLCRKLQTPQSKVQSSPLKSPTADSQNRVEALTPKKCGKYYKELNVSEVICKVCSQVFKSSQLTKHIFSRHTTREVENAYMSPKNVNIFTKNQQTYDQVLTDIIEKSTGVNKTAKEHIDPTGNTIEQAGTPLENGSNTGAGEFSALPERDAIEGRNNPENLSGMKRTGENAESTKTTKTIQPAGKNKVLDAAVCSENVNASQSRISICKCHDIKGTDGDNVYIEIVVLCELCQTLYRRFECYEAHFQRYTKDSTCVKDRKRGRQVRLLCHTCHKIIDSIQDVLYHLKSHVRPNCKIIAGFRCNICKVIFYGFGNMFKNHYHLHVKNPFFLASRLTFPQFSFIGTTLTKMPSTHNENLLEIYMQIADFLCRVCKKVFPTEEAIKLHETFCRKTVAAVTAGTDDVGSSGSTASGKSSSSVSESLQILLICGFCNTTFYNKESFEVHSLEHKQKRNIHQHYTSVAVTVVMKIYICKVCTNVCHTLKKFEEHWATHGALQEEYVCSVCQNPYHTFDLFKQHVIVHKNTEEKQEPILCKVIYRDASDENSKTNDPQEDAVMDSNNLLQINLNGLQGDECASNKSYIAVEVPSAANNYQPARAEATPRSNLLAQDTQDVRKDPVDVPEKISPTNAVTVEQSKQAVADTTDDRTASEAASKNAEENIEELEEEEEEEEGDLVIEMSESEEGSVSDETRQRSDNAQKSATTSDSTTVAGEGQRPSDVTTPNSSTKTCNDATPSSSSEATRRSIIESTSTSISSSEDTGRSIIQSNSTSKLERSVAGKNTTVTTTSTQINDTNKTNSTSSTRASNVNLEANQPKELLRTNVMSAVPKSFLRVKSLAELMSASAKQSEKNQTSSAKKPQTAPLKPQFDPSMHAASPAVQNQPVTVANVSPISIRPRPSTQMLDTTNRRQYQVVGVKPLNVANVNVATNVTNEPRYNLTWIPPSNSTVQPQLQSQQMPQFQQVPQQMPFHQQQNLPSYVNQPNMVQQQQQQQQRFHQMPPLQPVSAKLQQNQQLKQQLKQNQSQQYQKPQLQQQQTPQLQQQLQLLQQRHLQEQQRHLQQEQQQQQQQQQQRTNTSTVRSFVQPNVHQTPITSLPVYYQRQQNQQLTDASNKVMFNYVPYQLSTNNNVPANPINSIPSAGVNTTMRQVSQNPERYACVYCPGFECNSVQQFTLHERSPKHEARSHYNSVSYVSR